MKEVIEQLLSTIAPVQLPTIPEKIERVTGEIPEEFGDGIGELREKKYRDGIERVIAEENAA